jgi:hypothetical protein
MTKIYGIHTGCIFEGGSSTGTFYTNKQDAIDAAVKLFEKSEEQSYKLFFERDREHYDEYKWEKCDSVENRWDNTVDEIVVFEAELI